MKTCDNCGGEWKVGFGFTCKSVDGVHPPHICKNWKPKIYNWLEIWEGQDQDDIGKMDRYYHWHNHHADRFVFRKNNRELIKKIIEIIESKDLDMEHQKRIKCNCYDDLCIKDLILEKLKEIK